MPSHATGEERIKVNHCTSVMRATRSACSLSCAASTRKMTASRRTACHCVGSLVMAGVSSFARQCLHMERKLHELSDHGHGQGGGTTESESERGWYDSMQIGEGKRQ